MYKSVFEPSIMKTQNWKQTQLWQHKTENKHNPDNTKLKTNNSDNTVDSHSCLFPVFSTMQTWS